ncbi:MAG: isochorismate lyase [Candidatus Kapabacteria bacterium]|jgi:isochorismate pyruvate lyase|nr:isochorismate lyase [Candidatus Kapabacteria bacterium]
MKTPEQCESIQDIRTEIDRRDRQIIALLGERLRYVRAASQFKTSEASVRAVERVRNLLQDRRTWAVEEGLDPEIIEKMYRDLLNFFIEEEMNDWKATKE